MSSDVHSTTGQGKPPASSAVPASSALDDLSALLAAPLDESPPAPTPASTPRDAKDLDDALAAALMMPLEPSLSESDVFLAMPRVAAEQPPVVAAPPLRAAGLTPERIALAEQPTQQNPLSPPLDPSPADSPPPAEQAPTPRPPKLNRRNLAWLMVALGVVAMLLFGLWYVLASDLMGPSSANRPPPTPRPLLLQQATGAGNAVAPAVVVEGIDARFAQFYASNGGERRFGKPLGASTTLNGRDVQWFERARLEYVPEQANTPFAIQIGLVGSEFAQGRTFDRPAPFTSRTGLRYVAETGYSLGGRFLDYWERSGGLPILGFPISEELVEVLEDGKSYRVQYFERARLEYHPESVGTPDEIQVGKLGQLLQSR